MFSLRQKHTSFSAGGEFPVQKFSRVGKSKQRKRNSGWEAALLAVLWLDGQNNSVPRDASVLDCSPSVVYVTLTATLGSRYDWMEGGLRSVVALGNARGRPWG